MDAIDREILAVLQRDGRITATELAKRIQLGLSATSERLRQLRRSGVILGYTVVVALIWLVATVLAIVLPELETGTDPTKVPLGAIFAPLAASVLTALAGVVAVVFGHGPPAAPDE